VRSPAREHPLVCTPTRRLRGSGTRLRFVAALGALLLVLSIVGVALVAARADTKPVFTGRIVKVLDGDTLTVLADKRETVVRLHGVDAPEAGQAFGQVCRRVLANMVNGATAIVTVVDTDRYGRTIATLTVAGRDIGLEMVRAGCAWHFREYSNSGAYSAAEDDARRAKRGLWQDASPTPPWSYRQTRAPRRGLVGGPGEASETVGPFRGNVKSRVFHAPGCQHYSCASCTAVFETREAAVAAGFRPHAECVKRE
jgi:endonuclease YncB( thermonuclease family)